jgi:SAM-dependent methyltransferase
MGNLLNIITPLHKKTTNRDYLKRMIEDKVECMKIAKEYGKDYWDGDRKYGYGGYKYDGRWEIVAKKLIEKYNLQENSKILDVGCGKGFLLFEFKKLLPGIEVSGFDISEYAIENSKEEIKPFLSVKKAQDKFEYENKKFDLTISVTTLHNLYIDNLKPTLQEIERVSRDKYIVVESYRNEKELFNLQCWALTCNSFFSPKEWEWLFKESGYNGDYEFIYFE